MQLTEKYRPRRLAQVVGQDKAIAKVRQAGRAGLGGKVFWISGKSGTGKTTLARIIAAQVADPFFITEIDAGKLTADSLRDIERAMGLFGWGKGGRAYIINEAHGLRRDIVRALLVLLERVPQHCLWVFTTTTDGMALFEDGQIDAGPLLSRCIPIALTSQGIAPTFARLGKAIAMHEGLDGQDVSVYLKRVNHHKGNFRALLQDIQAGEMMMLDGDGSPITL